MAIERGDEPRLKKLRVRLTENPLGHYTSSTRSDLVKKLAFTNERFSIYSVRLTSSTFEMHPKEQKHEPHLLL